MMTVCSTPFCLIICAITGVFLIHDVTAQRGQEYTTKNNQKNINTGKVDNIFSLLADIEPRTTYDDIGRLDNNNDFHHGMDNDIGVENDIRGTINLQNNLDKNLENNLLKNIGLQSGLDKILQSNLLKNIGLQSIVDSGILNKWTNLQDVSTLKNYFSMLNSVSSTFLKGSKSVEDIMKTYKKVSKVYEHQKQKMEDKLTYENAVSKDDLENYFNHTDGMLASTSRVVNHLLEPGNVVRMMDISQNAHDEDQILEQLTTLILGAEERSGGYGSSLTLDPVTCIALATLAVYLIRAVYQILIIDNAKKRSLDNRIGIPETLYDLPRIMVNIHKMISGGQNTFENLSNDVDPTSEQSTGDSLLDLSTEIAMFVKLTVDGNTACVKNFICDNLAGKSFKDFGLSELFWSSIGLYKGEYQVAKYLSKTVENKDEICQYLAEDCENLTDEGDCIYCSPFDIEGYLQLHKNLRIILKMFSSQFGLFETLKS